jgi:hypothetical protein
MIPCSGNNSSLTWCCGDSDECCTSTDQTDLVSLAPRFTVAVITSTSSVSRLSLTTTKATSTPETSIAVSTGEQTSTTSALPSGTGTPAAIPGLSRGAKAGIAIGAVVGAVVLVMLGVWISKTLAWRRDAYAARAHNDPSYYTSGSDMQWSHSQQLQKYAYYAEADAITPPVEVAATPDPVEAPDCNQASFRNSQLGRILPTKYS